MTSLTRNDILSINDIEPKEITIPDDIPGWGGKSLYIRPLTRAQQDEYQRRQFGDMKMKQTPGRKQTSQELVSINLYGHDTWLFIRGVCDQSGQTLFTDKDMEALKEKSGQAIGWVAQQILTYSKMSGDDSNEAVEEEAKNSSQTKE
jgi:hypothetical protein